MNAAFFELPAVCGVAADLTTQAGSWSNSKPGQAFFAVAGPCRATVFLFYGAEESAGLQADSPAVDRRSYA